MKDKKHKASKTLWAVPNPDGLPLLLPCRALDDGESLVPLEIPAAYSKHGMKYWLSVPRHELRPMDWTVDNELIRRVLIEREGSTYSGLAAAPPRTEPS